MKTKTKLENNRVYKIGLDCRLAGPAHAGLGRYIQNLAIYLPLVLPENYHLYYFFAQKKQWQEILLALAQTNLGQTKTLNEIQKKIKPQFAPINHYSWQEQTQLAQIFNQAHLDLLHVPHFNLPYLTSTPKIILTVHDLLWHEKKGLTMTTLPAWQYYAKYLAYRFLSSQAIKKADQIITPSQTIKKTILSFYPTIENKITVIYNGTENFNIIPASNKFKQILPEQFLLYVGSLYPHKNLKIVLEALTYQAQLNLVIVSARNAFWEKTWQLIKKLGISQQVTFLGAVNDQQLKFLYQKTQALVQPSLSEGFGLTGIEAMSCGTPVIASAIPIFREIYNSAFIPFNPLSSHDFLLAYQKLKTLNRAEQAKINHQRAQFFNWQKNVYTVTNLYQKILTHA